MQESGDQYAQDIQGHRTKGQMLHGWFFGFKLHLICNEKGELPNFMITPMWMTGNLLNIKCIITSLSIIYSLFYIWLLFPRNQVPIKRDRIF